jgi:hypothetical protein
MMRIMKKIVNDNFVLDGFIICQKLLHVQVIKKITLLVILRDLHSNPQSTHSPLSSTWNASNTAGFTMHKSHPFCTTLDLQLSFYRPLCYNNRAPRPPLQCLRTTSAIVASVHSYFVVSLFKCEGKIVVMT